MQKNTEPNGTECWEHNLCCADDVSAMSHDPVSTINYPNTAYALKAESVKELDKHLGSQICKHNVKENLDIWAMSLDLCVKRALADPEREQAKINQTLCNKVVDGGARSDGHNVCRVNIVQAPG